MNLNDTFESVIRCVVPKPIVVNVTHAVTVDEVRVILTSSSYAQFSVNGLELSQCDTPVQFANLIEPRLKEALVALAEQLADTAHTAEDAAGA